MKKLTFSDGFRARVPLLALCLLMLVALPSRAQDQKVTLDSRGATVQSVMSQIESQTGLTFFYENTKLNTARRVSINAKDERVSSVLERLFAGTDVSFSFRDRNILLANKPAPPRSQAGTAKRRVSGSIADSNGLPLPGVAVVVPGINIGTVTDGNGQFSIDVPLGTEIIEASSLGFRNLQIPLSAGSVYNVIMEDDVEQLEEAIAIGYGTVKKSDLTGAVSGVNARLFKDQPIKQTSEILQGRMAGVVAQNFSGAIGAGLNVRIRGISSINFGNDPLWVVDGVIGGSAPNPDDIEAIEVLKDASSTAIYGSRGANGVILVTTKQGQAGRPRVEFSTQVGISSITKKYDLMNAFEQAKALSELTSYSFDPEKMAAWKAGTAGYDYYDLMLQHGIAQDYKLSVSGGNGKTRYIVSGQYLDQTGITITSHLNRYAFRTNLTTEVLPWLDLTTNVNLSLGRTRNTDNADLLEMANWSPFLELTDEDGVYLTDGYSSIGVNPYGEILLDRSESKNYNANGCLDLKFKILPGLTFDTQGSIIYTGGNTYNFQSSKKEPNGTSSISQGKSTDFIYQWTNNLTYQKDFAKDHHLTATGVWEIYKTHTERIEIGGTGILNEQTGFWNINSISSAKTGNLRFVESQLLSALARVQYNYKGKYFFTAAARADGSSKFQKRKWGFFPSAAAAWDVAKEDFLKDIEPINQLKLRASFGVSGNQAISSYATLGALSLLNESWATGALWPGYWMDQLDSPNLSWEKTYQYDLGIDVSLLKSRINLNLDWYYKDTRDLLFELTIPYYAGSGSYYDNVGSMYSTGVEFTANFVPVRTREFDWSSTFTAAWQKNEVTDLYNEEFIIPDEGVAGTREGDAYIIKEGYPLSNFHIWKFVGFDESGASLYQTKDGGTTTSLNDEDRIITGSPVPKWTFGWNNTFNWRNWQANILLRASTGFQRLNTIHHQLSEITSQSLFVRTRESYYANWDKVYDKKNAKYAAISNARNASTTRSTKWLEDTDFLRLQNVSVSYTIPKKITSICDIALGVSAQNLFTLTKYSGYDPEATDKVDGDKVIGRDVNAYPSARTVTFTAKLIF